jgi:hypothetical protein
LLGWWLRLCGFSCAAPAECAAAAGLPWWPALPVLPASLLRRPPAGTATGEDLGLPPPAAPAAGAAGPLAAVAAAVGAELALSCVDVLIWLSVSLLAPASTEPSAVEPLALCLRDLCLRLRLWGLAMSAPPDMGVDASLPAAPAPDTSLPGLRALPAAAAGIATCRGAAAAPCLLLLAGAAGAVGDRAEVAAAAAARAAAAALAAAAGAWAAGAAGAADGLGAGLAAWCCCCCCLGEWCSLLPWAAAPLLWPLFSLVLRLPPKLCPACGLGREALTGWCEPQCPLSRLVARWRL